MFQFTIRDVLLVTVIVALYVGWAGDRHEMRSRIERLEKGQRIYQNINIDGYQRLGVPRLGTPVSTEY